MLGTVLDAEDSTVTKTDILVGKDSKRINKQNINIPVNFVEEKNRVLW